MFQIIDNLFEPAELDELLRIADKADFVDGRVSNPHNTQKKNLQIADGQARNRSAQIVASALFRREEFTEFALPKVMAPPMLTKYSGAMSYGKHFDTAFIKVGQRTIRTDLSSTIFLSDPTSYDGGELTVELGATEQSIKLPVGSAIVYPSNTMHGVSPVTRGTRLAAITFIESQVPDPARRDLLYELNEVAALEGLKMDPANYMRIRRVQAGLKRMFSEPAV